VISVWFLKQVIQHKHVSKIWTWPDLSSPDLARPGPTWRI